MKRGLAFGGLAALIIVIGALGITVLVPGPEVARAVWTSAVLALGVQLLSFAVARPFLATNPIAGWGIGSALRLAVVVVYGLIGVKALGLVPGPALLSLVAFLFVTMLVEPLFLKP